MRLSGVLESMAPYPFTRLAVVRARLEEQGIAMLDFSIGEPREETPAFIREALHAERLSTYPLAAGLPELRDAIATWCARRFDVLVDPATQVIPTLGSKEAIFHMAQVVGGSRVLVTAPGYPVAERGALFAGKTVETLPLEASRAFLPDLDGVDWEDVAILWLNYPNNPTAATAPLGFYERAAALAREHDFLLCSDEAYSEIYFGAEPPASALQVGNTRNVAVLNTLSKRSSMPGYRCGFVAGDPDLVAALQRYRPNVGTAPQEFVQRAAVFAWSDEDHVEEVRALYRAKRDVLLPALEALGLRHAGGDASFFLWLQAPPETTERLLSVGIVVAPGDFFGPAGEGYVRVALVPTLDECRRAADLLASLP